MESMSAALLCVHSNYGALFETAANWTMMYNLHEDPHKHAQVFFSVLESAILKVRKNNVQRHRRLRSEAGGPRKRCHRTRTSGDTWGAAS